MDGWFGTALPDDIERAIRYLNLTKEEGMNWGMMRGIWSSVADLAVVQAQDVLGLGHEARMNTPATLGGNWCWRALPGAFTPELAQKLHDAMELYGRLPEEPAAEPDETEKLGRRRKSGGTQNLISPSPTPPYRSSFRCGGFFRKFLGCALATDGPDAGWYTKGTLQGMLNQQPGRAGMKTPTFESAFCVSTT